MILITGASSGIGEATAKRFAQDRKNLILLARRKDRIESLATALAKEYGIKAHAVALDVRDKAAIDRLAKDEALLSQVTVLVNNAGLSKTLSTIQDADPADLDETIDTNIKGLLYTTKLMLPFFLKKREGHIVNLSSVAAHWAYVKGNAYCASKSAVSMLTETMRLDLNGTGIRVTEITPGMVETEFSVVRLGDKAKADAVYQGFTPLSGEDIAETIHWAVNRPKHVNIQEIVVYPTEQAAPGVVARK